MEERLRGLNMVFRKVERDDPSKHFYDDPPGQRVLHYNDYAYFDRVKELTEGDLVQLADGSYIDHTTAQNIEHGFNAEPGSRILDYRDPQYDQLIGHLVDGDQVRAKDGSLINAEKAQQSWYNLMDQTEEVKQPMESIVHYTDVDYLDRQVRKDASKLLSETKDVINAANGDPIALLKLTDPTFREAFDQLPNLAEEAAFTLAAKSNNKTIQGYALAYALDKEMKNTDLSGDYVVGDSITRSAEELGIDTSPIKDVSEGIYFDESTMTLIVNKDQLPSEMNSDFLELGEAEAQTESEDLELLADPKEEEEQEQENDEEISLFAEPDESENIQMDPEPDIVESEEVSQEI